MPSRTSSILRFARSCALLAVLAALLVRCSPDVAPCVALLGASIFVTTEAVWGGALASRIEAWACAPRLRGPRLWVIFLEMGVALGLLGLIVWWTWPKKRPQDKEKD